MKTQSRIRLVVGVVFPLVLFISLVSLSLAREGWTTVAMFPTGENTFDFTNNETEDAYDLHIKWSHAVTVKEASPFKKIDGSGTSSTDLSNGVVKKGGGKASVKVSWDGSEPKVKEWWWTKQDGSRLGEIKKGNPTTASVPLTPSSIIRDGLRVVTFDTLAGRVIVNLPDDMRAGDAISGTVIADPKGQTEDERTSNEKILNSLFVNFAGSRVPVGARAFRLSVPGGETTAVAGNTKRGGFRIIIEPPGPQDPPVKFFPGLRDDPFFFDIPAELLYRPAPQPPQQYQLPTMGQTGRPIVISGPFDGNSSNTGLSYRPCVRAVDCAGTPSAWVPSGDLIVAESPRQAVFTAPTSVIGPIEIRVNEGTTETKAPFRSVGVNLSAPKTSLMKGESTTLKIEVSGLQGITEPVPLHLVKGGVVTMQGGDVQSMTIKPAEVQSNGTFTTTRTITGVQTGVWNATATVVVFDTCLEDDGDPLRVLLFNVTTGDYIFCPGRGSVAGANPTSLSTLNFGGSDFTGGVRVAAGDVNDSGGNGSGLLIIGPGASMYRNGAITVADFNYKVGGVHVQIDAFNHTGNATVQTTQPKQTFTITDRDTRNNTCACK